MFFTSIFIAAALKGGFSEDILRIASNTDLVSLISSDDILKELSQKLIKKYQWGKAETSFFVKTIKELCEIVEPIEKINIITRDPEDNIILECVVAGNAELIISSAQDLLALKTFRGIGIVHPKTLTWTFPEYFKNNEK